MDLSLNLRAIVAQRLVPGKQDSLHLAAEVLINTPYVAELIRKGNLNDLRDIIAKGGSDGMQSFDQALLKLYREEHISKARALEYASSRNDMEWQLNFGAGETTNGASKPQMPEIIDGIAA